MINPMSTAQKRKVRVLLYIRQRGSCAICGAIMHLHHEDIRNDPAFAATIDHIKRLREGGSNRIENLRVVCHHCNQRRN